MIKLLQILIYGHEHRWEIIKETPANDGYARRWQRYYLQCKHCGNVKVVDCGS